MEEQVHREIQEGASPLSENREGSKDIALNQSRDTSRKDSKSSQLIDESPKTKIKTRAKVPSIPHVLLVTACFLLAEALFLIACLFIPDIDTGSEHYRVFYERGHQFNTTQFPLSTLVFYTGSNVLGFIYVNISNLNMVRKSVLWDNHESSKSFVLTIAFAPIFFPLSAIMILRFPGSVNSVACEDVHRHGHCAERPYTKGNCFYFNFLWWVLFYYFGLQFTHFDKGPLRNFSLTPAKIKQWPTVNWVLFAFILVLFFAALGFGMYVYIHTGAEWYYLGVIVAMILVFTFPTVILRQTHYLHLHHYTCGMLGILLLGYQNWLFALIHGFANGVMVEGGSRWGYDPIWYRKDPSTNSVDDSAKHGPPEDPEQGISNKTDGLMTK